MTIPDASPTQAATPVTAPVRSPLAWVATSWRRFRQNRSGVIGLAIIGAYVALAISAGLVAPYDPVAGNVVERLQPPSAAHPLGTDELGRDVLSRILHGAAISLQIQISAVVVALFIGVAWGLVAGYFGSWLDELSMRAIDVLLAFPSILLAITIVAILGGGFANVVLAVGIASVPAFARLVRGVVLGVRELEYVEAAHAIGETHSSIMLRYILPATIAPVIVQTSLRMATVLLTAAGLNFLGLGVAPPTPEWGAMLSNARDYLFVAPVVTAAPGLAITIVVLGFNLLGDGLRDVLDPRLRQ